MCKVFVYLNLIYYTKNEIAHAALHEFWLYAMKHEMTCIYDLKKGPILKEIKGCEYQCTSTKQTAEVKKGRRS